MPLPPRKTYQGMTKHTQAITQAKGRPMLHWAGKKPLESVEYFPAQEKEVYGNLTSDDWNKLFWGDNLQVLAHLLKEYRGTVDLIYIDPPFDSKADYVRKVKIRNQKLEGQQYGLLEEKQYTDIWEKDEYLQFMYERLLLMRELLSDSGSIYLHCDHRKEHHLRMLLEEVFGEENYLNTVSWRSQVPRGKKVDAFYYAYSTHYIHIFARNKSYPTKWHKQVKRKLITEAEAAKEYMKDDKGYFRTSDPGTYTYNSLLKTYKAGRIYVSSGGELVIDEANKRITTTKGSIGVKYYLEPEGNKYAVVRAVDNLWEDIPGLGTSPAQDTGYPTQKTEQLLKRIIEASTDEGDVVADFFIGSGTTAAVAQKLNRRWLACDINLGSIQTTTKRVSKVIDQQGKDINGFKVYIVNDYDVFKNEIEARSIVMDTYGVEPIKLSYFDGVMDNHFVKVMPLNRVLNKLDIKNVLQSIEEKIDAFTVKPSSKAGEAVYEQGVIIICSGYEMDVGNYLKKENKTDVKVEIRDLQTDKQSLTFKKPPEARIDVKLKGNSLSVDIKDFHSPMLIQKLELENAKALNVEHQASVDNYQQIIDSVAIDVDYNGELFNAEIMDIPIKQGVVAGSYTWEYKKPPTTQVAVKIVDVLGEEYFETFKV